MSILVWPALAPLILCAGGAVCFIQPAAPSRQILRLAEAAAVAVIGLGLVAAVLFARLPHESGAFVLRLAPGVTARWDAVSLTMVLLVAFIGWVVVRYAITYLDGAAGQGAFVGWLCLTLAAVQVLVMAGDLIPLVLAWIASSLSLNQLLLFNRERAGARRAARKKFITARIGDTALIGAAALLWLQYHTTDITSVLRAAHGHLGGPAASAAAALLATAALLKSAQFPTHGWLTEAMEAPTPVSALLHAGVVNAGGFLLIRFADLILLAPGVMAGLVVIGGFTALFGGLVMLTQPAVKTALAWSTVAQMGFMILECGLGLFPLALLHIVAHSLYKAHAFLASGGAVEAVAAQKRPGPVAIPKAGAVARAFTLALALYLAVGLPFGVQHKSPQAVALGAILIFGVAYLLAQGLADAAPRALTRRTIVFSVATASSYFALQILAIRLTAPILPPPPTPGPLEWGLIGLAVVSFGLAAIVQTLFPLWANHPAAAGLRVHLANGFYANAVFDRLIAGWRVRNPA